MQHGPPSTSHLPNSGRVNAVRVWMRRSPVISRRTGHDRSRRRRSSTRGPKLRGRPRPSRQLPAARQGDQAARAGDLDRPPRGSAGGLFGSRLAAVGERSARKSQASWVATRWTARAVARPETRQEEAEALRRCDGTRDRLRRGGTASDRPAAGAVRDARRRERTRPVHRRSPGPERPASRPATPRRTGRSRPRTEHCRCPRAAAGRRAGAEARRGALPPRSTPARPRRWHPSPHEASRSLYVGTRPAQGPAAACRSTSRGSRQSPPRILGGSASASREWNGRRLGQEAGR